MLLALPFFILSAVFAVSANLAHGDAHAVVRHHPRISIPRSSLTSDLRKRKSCQNRSVSTTAHKTTSISTKKASTTTKAAAKSTNLVVASVSGLMKVQVSRCGPNGATKKITPTSGPNGDLDWFNCGITGSGWNPPYITVNDIVAVDLTDALKSPSTPFSACSKYVQYFEKYGNQYGIPAIILASFAMQESSCDASTVGGAGEQGLMQLTVDKCGGAPNNDCKNPDFNIKTGARYFSQTLSDNNGNLLLSIGNYNGWYDGLTVAAATAARWTSCCRCQNNLDYLHQFLNGWVQNINAYSNHLGKYFNLDPCPGKD